MVDARDADDEDVEMRFVDVSVGTAVVASDV